MPERPIPPCAATHQINGDEHRCAETIPLEEGPGMHCKVAIGVVEGEHKWFSREPPYPSVKLELAQTLQTNAVPPKPLQPSQLTLKMFWRHPIGRQLNR